MMPPSLPLARYRITFRMTQALRLPDYAGSLLRGAFGAALRRVSCMTGADRCDGCPLRATCPYSTLFATPAPATHAMQSFSHVPNPYVIEPPPRGTRCVDAGGVLQFCIVLVGHAVTQLPLISFALQRAAAAGFGKERAHGLLESIEWQAGEDDASFQSIWQAGDDAIAPHDARVALTPPAHASTAIRLRLHTPLRLQQQGHPVRPQALTPRKLVADLLRRTTLLAEFHAGHAGFVPDAPALVRHADTLTHTAALRWQDWERYSSRQQQAMKLGGAIGDWTLHGELGPLLPWLRLGQRLHVGKNTVFGLGHYTLHAA